MGKFIIATFLILGWGFYELSGGADFEPEPWPGQVASIEVEALPDAAQTADVDVTRADTTTLNVAAITQTPASITPATEEPVVTEVVAEIAPVIEPVVEEAAVTPAAPAIDLRAVAGTRVNMREGPGTNYGVIDTLTGGTQAEVIEVNADGWARIRLVGTNQTGWMAERLLNPI